MEQETNPHILLRLIVLILISNILQLKKNSYLHILLYDDVIASVIYEVNDNHNMMCILTLVIDRKFKRVIQEPFLHASIHLHTI
jgi:hypothetical protein